MTDPLADTRLVIRYATPAEFLRQAIAHAEKLGLVKGTGTLYAEGERRAFTEWTVPPFSTNVESH
jgi:hypothetical protein